MGKHASDLEVWDSESTRGDFLGVRFIGNILAFVPRCARRGSSRERLSGVGLLASEREHFSRALSNGSNGLMICTARAKKVWSHGLVFPDDIFTSVGLFNYRLAATSFHAVCRVVHATAHKLLGLAHSVLV